MASQSRKWSIGTRTTLREPCSASGVTVDGDCVFSCTGMLVPAGTPVELFHIDEPDAGDPEEVLLFSAAWTEPDGGELETILYLCPSDAETLLMNPA